MPDATLNRMQHPIVIVVMLAFVALALAVTPCGAEAAGGECGHLCCSMAEVRAGSRDRVGQPYPSPVRRVLARIRAACETGWAAPLALKPEDLLRI
jgi:hypothetical protein